MQTQGAAAGLSSSADCNKVSTAGQASSGTHIMSTAINPTSTTGDRMTEASETLPDVRLLSKPEFVSEGVNARFPGAGPQDFRIYFTPETHRSISQHAHETTSVEIGGVLVGHWGRDEDGALRRP